MKLKWRARKGEFRSHLNDTRICETKKTAPLISFRGKSVFARQQLALLPGSAPSEYNVYRLWIEKRGQVDYKSPI